MFKLTCEFWRLIPGQNRGDGKCKTRKMTKAEREKYGEPVKVKKKMGRLCGIKGDTDGLQNRANN